VKRISVVEAGVAGIILAAATGSEPSLGQAGPFDLAQDKQAFKGSTQGRLGR